MRVPLSAVLAFLLAACNMHGQTSASVQNEAEHVEIAAPPVARPDFNRDIYYKHKLELSEETGWLPINIPLVWDFLLNSPYTTWPLKYTMVPNLYTVRLQLLDPGGGWKVFRGNTELSASPSYTAIPRGAESRYFALDFGLRRNFVQPRWRVAPYMEMRGGFGNIDAKGPAGVKYAQGQDLTFTYMWGAGARYNFNSKYSVAAGFTYMHVSNFFLSEPKFDDYGINVCGPIIGFNMRLGKPRRSE